MKEKSLADRFKESVIAKGLYVATRKDVRRLVEVAVDGYGSNYPLCQWFDQGGDGSTLECKNLHPRGWASAWKANFCEVPFDESIILADSPEINAHMMWFMPGFHQASNLDWLLSGGIAAFFHMGLGEMVRFDTYESYCNAQRLKYGADSFYAVNLVVGKASQGKGLGSLLMRSAVEIVDELGASAYLETHTVHNMELYKKFGFRLMCDDPIPGTVLKHYAMRRG